jgi:hypothetical protein
MGCKLLKHILGTGLALQGKYTSNPVKNKKDQKFYFLAFLRFANSMDKRPPRKTQIYTLCLTLQNL